MGRQSETFFLIVFLCLELFIVKCRVLFYELVTYKHIYALRNMYSYHSLLSFYLLSFPFTLHMHVKQEKEKNRVTVKTVLKLTYFSTLYHLV